MQLVISLSGAFSVAIVQIDSTAILHLHPFEISSWARQVVSLGIDCFTYIRMDEKQICQAPDEILFLCDHHFSRTHAKWVLEK